METSVTPWPFPGDPGHEGGMKPMQHLQGGSSGVHTQMPDLQEANTGSAVGSPMDSSGGIGTWDNTSLATTGGAHNHTSDTARTKST